MYGNSSSSKSTAKTMRNKTSIRSQNEDSLLSVMGCRKIIDHISNECIKNIIEEIDRINRMAHDFSPNAFKSVLFNLCLQQKEFGHFDSALKRELNIVDSCKDIECRKKLLIERMKMEAVVFREFFPAYGVRSDVLNLVEEKQVTFLSSECAYRFNVALPILLYNKFRDYSIISCESSRTLSMVLRTKIEGFFHAEKICGDKVSVCSEELLLDRLSEFDPNLLSENYCLVYNVPLKRSITTDILLAKLRDFLLHRPESHLVLLVSKYDCVQKFVEYFSALVPCLNYSTPALVFPTKTVWRAASLLNVDECVNLIVDTIISVHVLQSNGDILAFLPSDADVQVAAENLDTSMHKNRCHDLLVICSDGTTVKTNSKQTDGFYRKAYLVSSSEEGLVIPNVKYVIDCGLQRMKMFSSDSGTSIVTPCFISQAKAQSRKEIAAISCAGVCYRMYSKENYKEMLPFEFPEVFCLDPLQSCLQILKYSPAPDIQFVVSLPSHVQDDALATLKHFKAIENFKLTPIGVDIAKLPFQPRYSRFLCLASNFGLVYEAVVLVAFFMCEFDIFIEPESDSEQRDVMEVKMEFYQEEGDTVAYLNMFREWGLSRLKKKWCAEKHLNYAAMKDITCKIKSISFTLEEYGKPVEKKLKEDIDNQSLLTLILICFSKNLCVYTGHYQVGYEILATRKHALTHSSSFLSYQNKPSKFIIFDKLVESYKDSICGLTCIPKEMIVEFQDTLPYEQKELFTDKLALHVLESVGENIISDILYENRGSKVKELEDKIKKDLKVPILLIEPILQKGCVNIFALPSDIQKCVSVLKEILEKELQSLVDQKDYNLIKLKKGDKSINVQTNWVKGAVTESFKYIYEENVENPVSRFFGNVFYGIFGNLLGNSKTSEENDFSSNKDTNQGNSDAITYSLKLSWKRRSCNDSGLVAFKTRKDFDIAKKLIFKDIQIGEKEVFVDYSPKARNHLLLSGIPSNSTEEDVINSLAMLLPDCDFEISLSYSPAFETTPEKLELIRQQIKNICHIGTNLIRYEVKVAEPKPNDLHMKASINVFELRDLEIEAVNLRKQFIDGMKVDAQPFYHSSTKCGIEMYHALKYRLKHELLKFDEEEMIKHPVGIYKMDIDDKTSKDVTIAVSSNDIEVMRALQRMVYSLLDGVKLTKSNLQSIHKLFCHGGYLLLKNLEETEHVKILQNVEGEVIRLYGLQGNCNRVAKAILEFLEDTENEKPVTIDLKLVSHSRALLKQIIQQYGVNLESFIETTGLRSAALDLRNCCITLNGKNESIEKADKCLKELSAQMNPNVLCPDFISEEKCVQCFDAANNFMHRLELCGHIYCSDCIQFLIEMADFPLRCCAEGCSTDIILKDIKNGLENDDAKIKELAKKSLKSYQEKNQQDLFFCPAPDCQMFFKKNDVKETKIQCPLCFYFICVPCHVVFHEGFTCDIYQRSHNDPDYNLTVYQENNPNCKHCPCCKAPIEKRSGCNHMTCGACGGHFCWLCLAPFAIGQQVYDHIQSAHKGRLFWNPNN